MLCSPCAYDEDYVIALKHAETCIQLVSQQPPGKLPSLLLKSQSQLKQRDVHGYTVDALGIN